MDGIFISVIFFTYMAKDWQMLKVMEIKWIALNNAEFHTLKQNLLKRQQGKAFVGGFG